MELMYHLLVAGAIAAVVFNFCSYHEAAEATMDNGLASRILVD